MKSQLDQIYNAITGDEDARVCKDIPDSACRHLPRNFFAYLCSNVLTKIADELASARLMLPWLLGSLGVPASFTGFLVPIREAGVLLPQLLVAAYIRRLPVRKWVWIIGAGLSALAMLLMALLVDRFHGVMAGWAVLVLITLFSLARGICSVSAKDVIGKTVSKTRRGVLMGYSAGISGVIVFCIGLYVMFYVDVSRQSDLFVVFLLACAIIWLLAILMFWLIREEPGAVEGGGNAIEMAIKSLALIKTDKLFREFLIARTLLLSVALVLPFYALMAQTNSEGISDLGMLIIAGGLAGSLSSPIWGKMGDQSSRRVMALSAIGAGILGIATFVLNLVLPGMMTSIWVYAVLFFLVSVCHSGVRLGRKTYLVDMSNQDNRSAYTAVSNTLIGLAMIIGGLFGVLADILNTISVIGLLGLVALLSAFYIYGIEEVSG